MKNMTILACHEKGYHPGQISLITCLNDITVIHHFYGTKQQRWQTFVGWLCGTVLSSWPKGCDFDPSLWQLLCERGTALVNHNLPFS